MRREGAPIGGLAGRDGGPLLAWYRRNARDLPWRRTRDPYAIWVSEVMLQQTRVEAVVPRYLRWMERFPNVLSLARASEDEALALWQGLGYYRRCRRLLQGARWILENGLPECAAEWRAVPGVGEYTAAAIASIALGEAVPVVDGNVERVFARLTGCRESGAELKRQAWKWAARNLFARDPGAWNQALMELGATVCTPRKPSCDGCPLAARCVAKQSWTVEELPVGRSRTPVRHLRHVVWVPVAAGKVALRRIPPGQWWEGLWEFPRVDATEDPEAAERELAALLPGAWPERLGGFRHVVTHHKITVEAWLVRLDEPRALDGLQWFGWEEVARLALPTPQRKVLRLAREGIG
ncbi:MAG: A/G-specific adenine glycosylase [Fimbriimonadales bacterium]|nr:A/G-specific adenine glycosylase [Fimbriimonadales bacterium]